MAIAIAVPLKISAACITALEPGLLLLPKVKHGVLGDVKIGLLVLKAGIEGSIAAAKINLSLIKDDTLVKGFQVRVAALHVKFDMLKTSLR
ncbi:cyclodeaminase/cyclohydrolase family protein [Sporomusa sp.]|uniref:cyclodeaminase/cyclohydrolase family protein n=1 Tax=Sporomusa sp. TaxID=2078658 RepID=UPI002D7FD603|nr:cyclodeaminase/cyclohydrolase family protein [Sporomusa sp.]